MSIVAVHHLNIGGIIPLTVLGFLWAVIYTQSRNLLVTILIHGAPDPLYSRVRARACCLRRDALRLSSVREPCASIASVPPPR